MFAPFEAYKNLHAMTIALTRLIFTKKNLLEWNTSASDGKKFSSCPLVKMFQIMWFVPFLSFTVLAF